MEIHVKKFIQRLFLELFGIGISKGHNRIVSLRSGNDRRGIVLLSYVFDPFLKCNSDDIPVSHTKYWESLQIAETFLELGFDVDVNNYDNNLFFPKKNYNIFIGYGNNFEKTAQRLN